MIPILYEATETSFTSNGIGRLRDAIKCEVTEERNGVYELDLEYPIDGAYFDEIIPGRIICATHGESSDVQPFDIVSYTKPIDGVASFHAVHISYRQSFLTVTASNINSLADALTAIETTSPSPNVFDYRTDFTKLGYMAEADGLPHTVRQMLGGAEGSILDTYGGEYEWDRFSVILHKNRGQMRDFTIRYGINMLDYDEEADYFGAFNSCVPYWTGESGPVIGNKVDSGLPLYNGADYCVPLDLTEKFETVPTTAQLEAEALDYMTGHQTNIPQRNIKIDFVRIQDFVGYEDFADLLECNLCDTIGVVFPKYGTSGTFKIVRTVWDALEGRYLEMELGALSTSLSEALGITPGGEGTSSSGGGISTMTEGIPYGECDGTSTSTAYTATVPGITELKNGTIMLLKNGVVDSAAGFTININGLGAKKAFSNMAAATQESTTWKSAYTILFIYSEAQDSGNGAWIYYRGYYSDANSIGYQLRTNSSIWKAADQTGRYRVLLTVDEDEMMPICTGTSTSATAAKTINTRAFDPHGPIRYYGSTTIIAQGSTYGATVLWEQYNLTFGYSVAKGSALTMTSNKAVYLKATPQANGKAVLDSTTPWVQDLPTTEDGKIYIYLGQATSATQLELAAIHPIYCYRGGRIVEWDEKPVFNTITPSSGSTASGQECYYAKSGNVVTVNIAITGLTANSTASITTLPAGYRPKSKVYAALQAGERSSFCTLEIGTDGAVTVATHSTRTSAYGVVSYIVE